LSIDHQQTAIASAALVGSPIASLLSRSPQSTIHPSVCVCVSQLINLPDSLPLDLDFDLDNKPRELLASTHSTLSLMPRMRQREALDLTMMLLLSRDAASPHSLAAFLSLTPTPTPTSLTPSLTSIDLFSPAISLIPLPPRAPLHNSFQWPSPNPNNLDAHSRSDMPPKPTLLTSSACFV